MTVALPHVTARHYVQPLREGGSLPAVVATDRGLYVAKFRGAGQGPKALIAELVCGMLARALDLPVPELAAVELPPSFGRSEPDPEIQDLLRASEGINVGLRYLDGAFNFAAAACGDVIDPALAARIVWFDAFITNPDRTARNVNILVCNRQPFLIDHGAALYAHHDWASADEARTRTRFAMIRRHALLMTAADIEAADTDLAPLVTEPMLRGILGAVPDELLCDPRIRDEFESADTARERYVGWLLKRVSAPRDFVDEAVTAQREERARPTVHLQARR